MLLSLMNFADKSQKFECTIILRAEIFLTGVACHALHLAHGHGVGGTRGRVGTVKARASVVAKSNPHAALWTPIKFYLV